MRQRLSGIYYPCTGSWPKEDEQPAYAPVKGIWHALPHINNSITACNNKRLAHKMLVTLCHTPITTEVWITAWSVLPSLHLSLTSIINREQRQWTPLDGLYTRARSMFSDLFAVFEYQDTKLTLSRCLATLTLHNKRINIFPNFFTAF